MRLFAYRTDGCTFVVNRQIAVADEPKRPAKDLAVPQAWD